MPMPAGSPVVLKPTTARKAPPLPPPAPPPPPGISYIPYVLLCSYHAIHASRMSISGRTSLLCWEQLRYVRCPIALDACWLLLQFCRTPKFENWQLKTRLSLLYSGSIACLQWASHFPQVPRRLLRRPHHRRAARGHLRRRRRPRGAARARHRRRRRPGHHHPAPSAAVPQPRWLLQPVRSMPLSPAAHHLVLHHHSAKLASHWQHPVLLVRFTIWHARTICWAQVADDKLFETHSHSFHLGCTAVAYDSGLVGVFLLFLHLWTTRGC